MCHCSNDCSLCCCCTAVVIRDDPVVKTAEDLFKALKDNTHVESLNLKNVKISMRAAELLAAALKTNTTLHTIVINCIVPSDGMLDIIKARCAAFFAWCVAHCKLLKPLLFSLLVTLGALVCSHKITHSFSQALGSNSTVHTLHVFQGPGKFWDSAVEKAMKDRLPENKSIVKLVLVSCFSLSFCSFPIDFHSRVLSVLLMSVISWSDCQRITLRRRRAR